MRRFFRLWYVRWIALPLLLVVLAHAGVVLVMAARFEARLDDLRQPGLPLELEEFAAPPVAEEDNRTDFAGGRWRYSRSSHGAAGIEIRGTELFDDRRVICAFLDLVDDECPRQRSRSFVDEELATRPA